MSIVWFNEQPKGIIVTISSKNITINKPGIQFFETANQVMLGFDSNKKFILIKPLSKDDVVRGDIPEHSRYNISISSTYARITNKSFVERAIELFNLSLEPNGTKYNAFWNQQTQILEVNIQEVI